MLRNIGRLSRSAPLLRNLIVRSNSTTPTTAATADSTPSAPESPAASTTPVSTSAAPSASIVQAPKASEKDAVSSVFPLNSSDTVPEPAPEPLPFAEDSVEFKILHQFEFYFSDLNLPRDKFMLALARDDSYGALPIKEVAAFPRIKKLTSDLDLIAKVLRHSQNLRVSQDGKFVRRLNPILKIDNQNAYAINWTDYFRNIVRIKDLKAALSVYFSMPTPPVAYLNVAIRKAGDLGDADVAKKIIEAMELKKIPVTMKHKTALVYALAMVGNIDEGLRVLDTLKSQKASLMPYVWVPLMNAALHKRDRKTALEIISHMKDFGVQPDLTTYRILLGMSNQDEAEALRLEIVNKLDLDVMEFRLILKDSGSKSNDSEEACAILKTIRDNGVIPPLSVFKLAIATCVSDGKTLQAFQIMKDMEECGIKRDPPLCQTLLVGCAEEQLLGLGEELFRYMERTPELQPNINHFNCVMSLYRECKQPAKALALFEQIESTPTLQPNLVTYNIAMGAAFDFKKYKTVNDIWNKVGFSKLQPNSFTYSTYIYSIGLEKGVKAAEEKLAEFNASTTYQANAYSSNILLMIMIKTDQPAAAIERQFEKTLKAFPDDTEVTYSIMIGHYSRRGQLEKMESCYQRFLDDLNAKNKANTDGVKSQPPSQIITRMLEAYKVAGKQNKILRLLEDLKHFDYEVETFGTFAYAGAKGRSRQKAASTETPPVNEVSLEA